jgi:hypothetical protein
LGHLFIPLQERPGDQIAYISVGSVAYKGSCILYIVNAWSNPASYIT